MNFFVPLTVAEKKKLRKLGAIRAGYMQEVYNAALANPQVLAASFNMEEYSRDVILMRDMLELLAHLKPFYEAYESTKTLLGAKVMSQSDEVYDFLKIAAKKGSDQALNSTIKKIADQLKQDKNTKSVE
jgi:hypothetical protein